MIVLCPGGRHGKKKTWQKKTFDYDDLEFSPLRHAIPNRATPIPYEASDFCEADRKSPRGKSGDKMKQKIAPTRGNLVKLGRALALAQAGHDLLEQKRQVLMMELVRYIDSAKEIQRDMFSIFAAAYEALQRANISLGLDDVGELALSVPVEKGITIRLRSVMGVEIPEIDPLSEECKPTYSFTGTSGAMDIAYVEFRKVAALLVKLAEVETCVYRLAIQIRKTHRRVNALEKVVIPSQRVMISQIAAVLEEGEREDFVRMKIAKSNRARKES